MQFRAYRMYPLSTGGSSVMLKGRKVPHVEGISTKRHKSPTMACRVSSSYAKSENHSNGLIGHVRHFGLTAAGSSRGRRGGSPKDTPPTIAQLRTLFFHSAVPMVGFGIMDNIVMISAGDLIDNTLGVKFGLATLTAAACGQVVSDVCGVCFGGTVEALAGRLGLPSPDLTIYQRGLRVSRITATIGAAVGVIFGCLVGMSALLFTDTASADREKKQREMNTLLASILDHAHDMVGAERCSLFFVDHDRQELWTKVATDSTGAIKTGKMITIPISVGVVGEVVRTRKTCNIVDVSKNSNFFRGVDAAMKTETYNLLAVPVISLCSGKGRGEVIAVIEMMNKPVPFDATDEKLVEMLAAHMAAFMKQLDEGADSKYGTAKPLHSLPKSPH